MFKKKVMGVVAGLALGAVALSACGGVGQSSAGKQAAKQETQAQGIDSRNLVEGQPVPVYHFSQIRQTMIEVEGAQANTEQTTTFFFNLGVKNPYMVCPSVGFPVAATDQITNPSVQENDTHDNGAVVVPQMDPNGIYGGDTAGTYVVCITPQGTAEVDYAEEYVHTVGGPAAFNTKTGTIQVTGPPTIKFTIGKTKATNINNATTSNNADLSTKLASPSAP